MVMEILMELYLGGKKFIPAPEDEKPWKKDNKPLKEEEDTIIWTREKRKEIKHGGSK